MSEVELFSEEDAKKLIEDFERYLKDNEDLAKGTIKQYIPIVNRLFDNCVIDKIKKYDYSKIITQENYDSISFRTLERPAFISLIEYFKYKEYIAVDQIVRISYRESEVKKTYKTVISHEEFENYYLSDSIEYKDDEERVSIKCVLALAYYCMFKQENLGELRIEDINLQERKIKNIHENKKGEKLAEWITMSKELFEIIMEYMKYRDEKLKTLQKTEYFLLINQNRVTSELNSYLSKFERRSGLELGGGCGALITNYIYNYLDKTDGYGLFDLVYTLGNESAYLNEAYKKYISLEKINNAVDFKAKENKKSKTNKNNVDKNKCPISELVEVDVNDNNKEKMQIILNKLVRNKKYVEILKQYYDNTCQVCGEKLPVGINEYYSEVHHIKPYNSATNGDDILENMIVLCTSCHKQFDRYYLAINPETLTVHYYHNGILHIKSEKINVDKELGLGREYLEYAWKQFLNKNNIQKK